MNVNIQNNGTINVAKKIVNNNATWVNNLTQELNILEEHLSSSDKELVREIIKLLQEDKMEKAKSLLSRLSEEAINVIKGLSLNVLSELLKKILKI